MIVSVVILVASVLLVPASVYVIAAGSALTGALLLVAALTNAASSCLQIHTERQRRARGGLR